MRYLLLIASLLCAPALADAIASNGRDSIRLTQGPCPVEVLRHIPEGYRGFFRSAAVLLEGKAWSSCWAIRPDGNVVIVYDDGDSGLVPVGQFKEAPGV